MENNALTLSAQSHGGCRLDKFLISKIPEHSRAYFQDLIDRGCVAINGKPMTKSSYTIKESDSITVTFIKKQLNLAPEAVEFEVLDAQEDFLIVNKPAGLLVHHTATMPDTASLINGLLHRYPEFTAFDTPERPGIVHRIDKNTSGLLIIARNPIAQATLSAMFKNRHISKSYLAVVNKNPELSGTIDLPIGRNPVHRHMMATFGIEARSALTHYRVLQHFQGASLIQADIITGRTHQIRVHCASMGHGLLGDDVYGETSKLIARQALHAWKMAFTYNGKEYSYTCPLPEDFKKLLQELVSNIDNPQMEPIIKALLQK